MLYISEAAIPHDRMTKVKFGDWCYTTEMCKSHTLCLHVQCWNACHASFHFLFHIGVAGPHSCQNGRAIDDVSDSTKYKVS